MESSNLIDERMESFRSLFPEGFTEGKIDFPKLREALGDFVEDRPERYSFSWAGKRNAIRLLQTPSRATLKPSREESVNFDQTNNLFIEGDNLEVLKLLYKSYAGRVKMIYIDPPYNTGKDFIYPDNFADPLDTYLRLTGQKDAEGNLMTSNPETSGRYHSAWLSMMYPRLFIARQLLREDGVIFISIDDHEVHNLRMLMNEIFGEENFVENFIWKKSYGGGAKEKYAVTQHEYILMYARNRELIEELWLPPDIEAEKKYYKYTDDKFESRGPYRLKPLEASKSMDARENLAFPIIGPNGEKIWPKRQWWWSKDRVEEAQKNNELAFIKDHNNEYSVQYKQYLIDSEGEKRGLKPFSIIDKIYTQNGTADLRSYFNDQVVIQFPKPVALLKKLIHTGLFNEEDIFVDFFAGSCVSAEALYHVNRQLNTNHRFIMVQLPEIAEEESVAFNAGYKTIADIGKERIRRVIKKMKAEREGDLISQAREMPEDLGFRVFKLDESNYMRWTGTAEKDADELVKQMELSLDPLIPGWKPEDVLWEIAIKEGLSLTSRIEKIKDIKNNTIWRITDEDKDQSLLVCLDNQLKPETPRALNLDKETRFICRDIALTDELAANLALQCRLKTI